MAHNPTNKNNIAQLVDRGAQLKAKIEKMQAELNGIVKELKTHAKSTNQHVITGRKYKYVLNDSEFLKIDPETLKEITTETQFMKLIKVDITQAKKELGEMTLRNFGVVEKKKFYSGKFQKL